MEIDCSRDDDKQVLLGINLGKIKSPPVMTIGRWSVYCAGQVPHVSYLNRNINYQIHGNSFEKIVVRFFISAEGTILKVKYYYLKSTDPELAYYITMELISRFALKYPLDVNCVIKKLKYL